MWTTVIGLAVMALILYWLLTSEEVRRAVRIIRKVRDREAQQKQQPQEANPGELGP